MQRWRGLDGAIRGAVFGINEENPGGQSPRYHPDHPSVLARHEGSGKGSHFGNGQHWGASRWDKRTFEEPLPACAVFFKASMEIKPVYASVMLEIAKTVPPLWCAAGLPFNEVYCASKFAVEGACESLAILLQHFNIQSVVSLIQRGRCLSGGGAVNSVLVSAACLSLSVAQSTLISWPTCRRQKWGTCVKAWTNRHSHCTRNTCSTVTLSSKIQHRTLRTLWRYAVKVATVGSEMYVDWWCKCDLSPQ